MIQQRDVSKRARRHSPRILCLFDGMNRHGIGDGLDEARVIASDQYAEAANTSISLESLLCGHLRLTIEPSTRCPRP